MKNIPALAFVFSVLCVIVSFAVIPPQGPSERDQMDDACAQATLWMRPEEDHLGMVGVYYGAAQVQDGSHDVLCDNGTMLKGVK